MADLKTLRICLSRDIPPDAERLPNYIYFGYDNLILYSGSELVEDDFCIVDSMPESPKENFIYILKSDGSIHEFIDYSDIQIAEVEDASQVELLEKVGSTYFVNSDSKYIDKQRRTLVLPYNNGVFELATNAQNEQVYNNDTILKYNEDAEEFQIYGDLDEFIDYSQVISGAETDTVNTVVSGSRLIANAKISNIYDNALKVADDGLYISAAGKVDNDVFIKFRDQVVDFEQYCHSILDNLEIELAYISSLISEESVDESIHKQLADHYPILDEALAAYQEASEKLETLESELLEYISSTLVQGINTIDSGLQRSSSWNNVSSNIPYYTNEVNYYDKSTEYDNSNESTPDPGIDRLTTIFYGTLITGESRVGLSFNTELESIPNDIYINTDTENMYRCVRGGFNTKAKWVYVGCIKYPVNADRIVIAASAINLYRQTHDPVMSSKEKVAIMTSAINKYKADKEEETKNKVAIIASAVSKYIADKS